MKDGDFIEHLFICSTARLPAVLHQPRQGLPLEGLRAARGSRTAQGPRAGQHPAAARGRAGAVGALDARLHRGQVPRLRDAQRHRQEDRVPAPTTRRSRPTASSRSTSATTTSSSPCAATIGRRRDPDGLHARASPCASTRTRRPLDGPRDRRRARDERRAARATSVLAMDVARDEQELLVVTENGFGKRTRGQRVPQDVARRQGRADDQVHREASGGLAAALVVRPHEELVFISAERHGPAHRRRAASARRAARPRA